VGATLGGFVLLVCGAMCAGLGVLMQKTPADLGDGKKKKKQKKRKQKKGDLPKSPPKIGSLVYGGGAIALVGLGIMIWGMLK